MANANTMKAKKTTPAAQPATTPAILEVESLLSICSSALTLEGVTWIFIVSDVIVVAISDCDSVYVVVDITGVTVIDITSVIVVDKTVVIVVAITDVTVVDITGITVVVVTGVTVVDKTDDTVVDKTDDKAVDITGVTVVDTTEFNVAVPDREQQTHS